MVQSRNDLINWYNNLCSQSYNKIEQFGNGYAYCQIISTLLDQTPPSLKSIKDTKLEYEFIKNYKILQQMFDKQGIEYHIPVDRLVKCKVQDNLEFLQFLKKYWDQHYTGGQIQAISTASAPKPAARSSTNNNHNLNQQIKQQQQQIQEYEQQVQQLEKEREFYFSKLRDIEVYIQQQLERQSDEKLLEIQQIMYKTEDGFEQPE